MNRPIILVVLLAISSLPTFAQTTAPAPPPGERIRIRGQEFIPFSAEKLRARGVDVTEIPRERNAAYVQFEAINAAKDLPADLNDAFDAAVGGRWPEGEQGDKLAAWLKDNQPAFDLLRRAVAMPDYSMPLMTTPAAPDPPMIAFMLPPLAEQRRLAKMLVAEGTYLQTQGQTDAAIQNYLLIHRFGNQISNGHTLIEGLVGVACNALAQSSLSRIADAGQADPAVLKAAIAELDELSKQQPDWETMLRSEEQMALGTVDDLINMPGQGFAVLSGDFNTPPAGPATGWMALVQRLKRVYFPDRTMKRHMKQYYHALADAGRPRADGRVVSIEEDRLFESIPAWDFPAKLMLPSLGRVHELLVRSHANHERAKLNLAIAAYRAEHQAPPPNLAALTPQYVRSIPLDPMTGGEFDFRPAAAPGDKTGLETINKDNEQELLKKRRVTAILSPRASRWRRYTLSIAEKYRFTEAQRNGAETVLRDVESRAAKYEANEGAKIKDMLESDQPPPEAKKKLGPLDELFAELQKRLETLPNAEQRAAAKKDEAEKAKAPPK